MAVAVPTAAPPEELTWEPAVTLAGESRPPARGERGFALRLHADPACDHRLAPTTALVTRAYAQARAADLCPACTGGVVRHSSSSVVRRLRDAERTLRRLLATAADPVPREIVHCRALRYEAEQAVSVHPDVRALAAEVADLATEVQEALRDGLRRALRPG